MRGSLWFSIIIFGTMGIAIMEHNYTPVVLLMLLSYLMFIREVIRDLMWQQKQRKREKEESEVRITRIDE